MKQRALNIIVALDIFLFAVVTLGKAKRNETISSAAWSTERDGKLWGRMFRPFIDWTMSWAEKDHCARAWRTENPKE
jgi:hypothetical protein